MSRNDPLDQTAHFLISFVLGIVGVDRPLSWWREWVQQWPPATDREPVVYVSLDSMTVSRIPLQGSLEYLSSSRVQDTKRDLLFYALGATVGNLVALVLLGVFIAVGR